MRAMIEAENLSRHYGGILAVDALNLRVRAGEVVGLLGPNGAGKTTSLRMLAGFLAPSSGRARIAGHDVERQPHAARRSLGYLPEGAPSYGEMSVLGFLRFIARVRRLSGERRRNRLDAVIQQLELEDVLALPIETLSKGFRRRVGLAQAILHDPPVLILDEPTDGLDPNQKQAARALIRGLARDRAILISTHLLEEVPTVCSRVAVIARGRLLADATPAELERRSRYHGAVSFSAPGAGPARAAISLLPGVDTVEVEPLGGRVTVFPKPGRAILAEVQGILAAQRVEVSEFALERGRLDDVFRSLTADPAEAA